jgi:hypothetical protein
MRTPRLVLLAILALVLALAFPITSSAASSPGIGNVPQGTQKDNAYARSFQKAGVTNVFATTQKISCYRPEVPYFRSDGPVDGYTGMSPCTGATTGEDTGAAGPYATQVGSNPGYPAATPMLVKDHSESDLRVDPTNPRHLIGQSKWFVSAEGYNHVLGFYESWDGGQTWPAQGHVPGYEGWTDNTDPVGAFDRYGNFYSFVLAYQFFYNADGTHNFEINPNQEPNPVQPAEVVAVAARPHGSTTATQWVSTHNGSPDFVASYDSVGREPDKQWIGIDTNPDSPFVDNIYAMWVVFTGPYAAQPFVAIAKARPNGTHTDWSAPISLPQIATTPQGATYLLPHVTPDGAVYTTLVNETPAHGSFASTIWLDVSRDGGHTWTTTSTIASNIPEPPFRFTNTTFRDGITATFGTGNNLVNGHYPLYVSWEDGSTGLDNVLLSASYDEGDTWTPPIQVNDNATPVDEFQPNLAVADNGTVSVAFYDRRLPCAAAGTAEAAAAGLALDTANPAYSGSLPPYGATNYCVNASVQFYTPTLAPKGNNIRLTRSTWDPQLNAPHTRCATCLTTFIGDYFGNVTGGTTNYSTFVSTYDDGSNPQHYQQQVVASVSIP